MPWALAFWAAFSAAVCAAKGVLFRDPLKPTVPALDQLTTFPLRSVMLIMVLLKVAWTWAIPCAMFLTSFLGPARGALCRRSVAFSPSPCYFGVGFRRAPADRRGPLRVRAFVVVRWPRTGSPRR